MNAQCVCVCVSARVLCSVVICIHLFRGNFTCNIGADLSWESNLHRLYIINRTHCDTAVTQRRRAAKRNKCIKNRPQGWSCGAKCAVTYINVICSLKNKRECLFLDYSNDKNVIWIFFISVEGFLPFAPDAAPITCGCFSSWQHWRKHGEPGPPNCDG